MEEKILEFIREEVDDESVQLDAETSLFRENVLDSMSLTTLISFLEDEFGIRVGAMDIVYENLDTVAHMCAFVTRKQSGG